MSRHTIKNALLEKVKEVREKQVGFIRDIPERLLSSEKEDQIEAEDSLRRFIHLVDLERFLEDDKYDPFLTFSADYPPGLYPAYPEGKTFWYIDDTDIEIFEEDLGGLISDIIGLMEKNSQNRVWEALQPEVIRNEYVTIIERCIHERKKGKS